MSIKRLLKNNLTQIFAITEKNLSLKLRFKQTLIIELISPLIYVLMPLIVLMAFFDFRSNLGPWTKDNFLIFQIVAYNLFLLKNIIYQTAGELRLEKFWKTLPSLIIAPFHRINLLLGIYFSHLIIITIPFVLFFIIGYVILPVSFITFLSLIGIYLIISLIFSGVGIFLSVLAISNENLWSVFQFFIEMVFYLSCISYPYQIFPEFIQNFIDINPFFHVFDFLRNCWIENDIIYTIVYHPRSFLMLIGCAIVIPCIGIYFFNYIYKKYGIVGS